MVYNNYIFKILLIGNAAIGKSSLLLRYCEDTWDPTYNSTIGVDFKIKNIIIKDSNIKLQFWDTAGQERFKTIVSSYYRNIQAIVIMFDLTNFDSFVDINKWIEERNKYCSSSVLTFFVGTKADLKKQIVVTQDIIDNLCTQHNSIYIETSAKDNINVNQVFETICIKLLSLYKTMPLLQINKIEKPAKNQTKSNDILLSSPDDSNNYDDLINLNNSSKINKYNCCVIS